MISAEIYKLRNQRTPWVLTSLATIAMFAPSVYFLFRQPSDASSYAEAVIAVFSLMSIVVGAVLGGWLLGHEYGQSTLRRVALIEARRPRLLLSKLGAGLLVLLTSFAASVAGALGVAALVALIHGDTLVMTDFASSVFSSGIVGVAVALLAFGLSAITRSSAYSTLTVLVIMLIFSPLLSLIPTVGAYTPGQVITQVSLWIAQVPADTGGFGGASITNARALVASLGWVGGTLLAGQQVFSRQDI